MLLAFKEHVPNDVEAQINQNLEVLVCLEFGKNLLKAVLAKVLLLDLDELVDMIFQLMTLQLEQIVLTQDHVLDQLGDLLVKLNHIRLSMNKLLNLLPIVKHGIVVGLLSSTSEAVDYLAKELTGQEG
jgi:hypothetical protein